jgi:transposase-like protein
MTTSIRKDSLFFASHCIIQTVIELIYFWCIKLPVIQAAYECSVGEGTAINYYKIFRGICVDLSVGSDRIGGPGTIVEIDEMKLGKRKFHRGKRVDGPWCFGGIVRREDKGHPIKCFVIPVEDRSANTLIPIILDNIEDGTTIYSDCWKAYDFLEDKGFKHLCQPFSSLQGPRNWSSYKYCGGYVESNQKESPQVWNQEGVLPCIFGGIPYS